MLELDISCALCQHPIQASTYQTEEEVFCCKGCQVVYQILKAQQSLETFQEHPIYRQALQSGLITNPHLHFAKDEEEKIPEDDFQKIYLTIQNMWCPSCAQVIHLILLREKGIRQCTVDYSTDLACIEFTPRFISKEKVVRLIQQMGYHPHFFQDPRKKAVSQSLMLRLIIATFFSLNVMMFAYPIYATYFDQGDTEGYAHLFAWLSLFGSLPVLFYSAWPIWKRFLVGLKVKIWGMEALVCIGVIAATGLSLYELFRGSPYVYFDSITVIIMFVLLGKVIESKAKFSAKEALVKLSYALPRRGRKRWANGDVAFVSIKEFHPGDFLLVKMGEKIVLDGIVEEGSGACDESLLTGESIPVAKQPKSSVLAGTFLQQGQLIIKVTASLEETALNQLLNVIGQEIEHKSRYVRAADQIVRWFVPFVILLAVLTAMTCLIVGISDPGQTVMQTAIIRAVSILLISCPCAIGIAAPLAESYLLNALAKIGIIVRNRGCLSFLGKETLFIFDKTGTVTEGNFTVCTGLENLTFKDQQILKSLVASSLHPLALAVNQALKCPPIMLEKIEEIVGKGIQGVFNGKRYRLGSAPFIQELLSSIPAADMSPSSSILTTIYFVNEENFLTKLVLGDQIKEEMPSFIQSLFPVQTYLVSGDSLNPVQKVAVACGIQNYYANYSPLQKKALIESLKRQGHIIAMLGDGMNDAPALTTAHVGMAVASASEMSIQVSDILLSTQHIHSLYLLRKIALKGQTIIKQNLFWAFFYNCIGLGLAVFGLLTPLFAAFAMVISSLIVLFNAQRIK